MDLFYKAQKIIKERSDDHFTKKAALKITEVFKDVKKYVLEAGFSPSGKIHLGNFGDILITEAVRKILNEWGYSAESIVAIDSRDPFRKPPIFLPKEFKENIDKYRGRPLETLPDPWGCHKNYVQHFVEPAISSLKEYGLHPKIVFANEIHQNPKYIELLRNVILNRDKVRRIFNIIHEMSGHAKRYPQEWIPYRPQCARCGRIDENVKPLEIVEDGYIIRYKCSVCGYEGEADIRKAEGKPPWRIDWPLRWVLFNVNFEPMGKDLMAAGSSYDTGKELLKKFFSKEPPIAIFYDFFYWVEPDGTLKKFSKRAGIGLGPDEWLKYAPPEVLNYLLLKRHIGDIESDSLRHFDFNVYDIPIYVKRYDVDEQEIFHVLKGGKITSEFKKSLIAYFLANARPEDIFSRKIRRVPYDLAIKVALWMETTDEGISLLKKIGALPKDASEEEINDAKVRLNYALNFIRDYWRPPKVDINSIIKMLSRNDILAAKEALEKMLIFSPEKIRQEEIREIIREVSNKYNTKPRRIYRAIYLFALGEETGPQVYRLFRKEFSRKNMLRAIEELKKVGV